MKHPIALRIGILVLFLAVASGLVLRSRRQRDADDSLVRGSGTVEATEIDVASETVGRIVELAVEEGDRVARDDVIAKLDDDTFAAELARAEAALYTAQMRLADVERGARAEEIRARAARLREAMAALDGARAIARTAREAYRRPTELKAAVDTATSQRQAAEAGVARAKAREAEIRAGARSQEIDAAQAALAQADKAVGVAAAALAAAEARVTGAAAELAEAERADAERQAADTLVDTARTQVKVAEADLAAAQARRDLVSAPPRPEQRQQLQHRRERAEAQLTLAAEELARARTLYESGAVAKKALDAAVSRHDQAKAAVDEAAAALRDLDAGAREMERREAAAAVAKAEEALQGAREALANAQKEQEIQRAGSRQQSARARSALAQRKEEQRQASEAVAQAKEQRRQAQAQLDLVLAGAREEQVAQATAATASAVATAEGAAAGVSNAEQTLRDRFPLRQQLEVAEQQVATARARVDAARAELDLALAGSTIEQRQMAKGEVMQAEAARDVARTRLDEALILAPRGGTISEVILREGESVSPGSVIVRMYDLTDLWVRVYLSVRQFGRVAVGDGTEVYADLDPDKSYPGRVIAVSDESEFTPKNTQTAEERVKQVFWVKIGVGEGRGELKPGLPVDVVIHTADTSDAGR